jgi:hypothetical protein
MPAIRTPDWHGCITARSVRRWGSWLEIELETGRTHQIRIQAASRGFPVLGDSMYASRQAFGVQHEDERLRAIALHGRTIEFQHPMNREPVQVVAPLSSAWRRLELPLEAEAFEPEDDSTEDHQADGQ